MILNWKYPVIAGILAFIMIAASLSIRFINLNNNDYNVQVIEEKYNLSPDQSFLKKTNNKANEPTARAYLVGDIVSGRIYLSSNIDKVLPVASMSKLITAAAALHFLSTTSTIVINKEDEDLPPDSSNLKQGESFVVSEIIYPLLLSSSNIAAEAIARTYNRVKFLELMSSYAWEIGMPNTFFADPSGLSPQNIASSRDIFVMAQYLYNMYPDILAITRIPEEKTATTSLHNAHVYTSTHPYINDERFLGGKTGRTEEAGETMLTILMIRNRPIAFVVLGSNWGERYNDTRILEEKFFRLY